MARERVVRESLATLVPTVPAAPLSYGEVLARLRVVLDEELGRLAEEKLLRIMT